MAAKIVLRRSARDEILWHFHVILDSVAENATGRTEFVCRILGKFGVSEDDTNDLLHSVCANLPKDLSEADMTEVLGAFETSLEIEWLDDLARVAPQGAARFEAAVLRILAERKAGQLPKAVTRQVMEELEQAFGPQLHGDLMPRLIERIENHLVRELWRSKDKPAQERLARYLIYIVQTEARLDLGSNVAG